MHAQTTATYFRRFRLLTATATLAVAAAAAQTAFAQPAPGFGPPGGPGGPAGRGGPGMMMDGRHMDRVLDAVNASADQRAQVKAIFQAARTDLQAQHEAGRALREQSMALFAQPTVDARAAEALRVQMVAQHDAASKRMLQAVLDASRVLTPDQRKTLSDKMTARKALMQRQRSERDALDKAGR